MARATPRRHPSPSPLLAIDGTRGRMWAEPGQERPPGRLLFSFTAIGPMLCAVSERPGRLLVDNAHLAPGKPAATPADRLGADPLCVRCHAFSQHRTGPRPSGNDASGAGLAATRHPLATRHDHPGPGARHPHLARAIQARHPRDAAAAALGAVPDRARIADPLPAPAAHRQHKDRPHRLRRGGQLSLRAGAAVAGRCASAERAPAPGLVARLHRHPFLAAALHALSLRHTGAAVHCHRHPARRAGRLHGVGPRRVGLPREPADVRPGQGGDQLAERGCRSHAGLVPDPGSVRLCRRPAARRAGRRLALLLFEHAPEDGHQVHGRSDRAGAAGADAARDQPQAQDPARGRLRRTGALLDLSRAHRRGLGLAEPARIPRGDYPRQHRGAQGRASCLPGPAHERAHRDAAAAAGECWTAIGRHPGARTRQVSRGRSP